MAEFFARFMKDQGCSTEIDAVDRQHVEEWMQHLVMSGKPSSALNRFRSLQQFFKWCVEENEIPSSPMAGMQAPHVPENPPEVLSEEELLALLRSCEATTFHDLRDLAILRVFIHTGCRIEEMAALRFRNVSGVSDVDLDGGIITFLGKGRRLRVASIGSKDSEGARPL